MTVRKLTEQEIDDIWYEIGQRADESNDEYVARANAYIEHHGYEVKVWRWSERHGHPWKYQLYERIEYRKRWLFFTRRVVKYQPCFKHGDEPMSTSVPACYMWAADRVRQLKAPDDYPTTDNNGPLRWIGPDYT